jgi:hypothetical protein
VERFLAHALVVVKMAWYGDVRSAAGIEVLVEEESGTNIQKQFKNV